MPTTGIETPAGTTMILRAAAASLEHCAAFLSGVDVEAYTRASARLFGSTIGQHVRHTIDHFAAVTSSLEGLVIDYDHRQRETPVEQDCDAAIEAIRSVAAKLAPLSGDDLAAPVRVKIMVNAEGAETELGSTLGRELAFATHHATHHFAMISSIATEFGIATPVGFGKAPSTVHHERQTRGESGR